MLGQTTDDEPVHIQLSIGVAFASMGPVLTAVGVGGSTGYGFGISISTESIWDLLSMPCDTLGLVRGANPRSEPVHGEIRRELVFLSLFCFRVVESHIIVQKILIPMKIHVDDGAPALLAPEVFGFDYQAHVVEKFG